MENTSYVRCKACNQTFHPCWRKEIDEFEDLCFICLPASREFDYDDEKQYLNGLLLGTEQVSDSELLEDPYYEYGENAFGDLNIFEKH